MDVGSSSDYIWQVPPSGDELFRLVFPPGTTAPSLSVDEDDVSDHFYHYSTEVCKGRSDSSGGVAWEQPMTPAQLSSAARSLRDNIKAARKAQLLSSLAACLQTEWVGGILALAPPTRPLLDEDGRAACDNLVRLHRRSVWSVVLESLWSLEFQIEDLTAAVVRVNFLLLVFHRAPACTTAQPQVSLIQSRLIDSAFAGVAASTLGVDQLTHVAEGLEAQGQYLKAADVHRRVLELHFSDLRKGLLSCPPLIYGYLGAPATHHFLLLLPRPPRTRPPALLGCCPPTARQRGAAPDESHAMLHLSRRRFYSALIRAGLALKRAGCSLPPPCGNTRGVSLTSLTLATPSARLTQRGGRPCACTFWTSSPKPSAPPTFCPPLLAGRSSRSRASGTHRRRRRHTDTPGGALSTTGRGSPRRS